MISAEHLSFGSLHATVLPRHGGALAEFYSLAGVSGAQPVHWLRPMPRAAWEGGDPLEAASFILVPWSNRIAHGRFSFDGHAVQLLPSPQALGKHSLHGLGWTQAWQISERSNAHVTLVWNYEAQGPWPWPFEAVQHYRLNAHGLQIVMALRNLGTGPMPAGLGHHPYFMREPDTSDATIRTSVKAMWATDSETLPVYPLREHQVLRALPYGLRVQDHVLDTHFPGFNGRAVLRWGDGRVLRMHASPVLNTLVIYTPAGKPFFCIEPVSHCANWLNLSDASVPGLLPGDLGGHVLMPGESLQACISFEPLTLPARCEQVRRA